MCVYVKRDRPPKKVKPRPRITSQSVSSLFFVVSDFEHFSFRNDRRTDVDVHVCILELKLEFVASFSVSFTILAKSLSARHSYFD